MNQNVFFTLLVYIGAVIIQLAQADITEVECKGVKYPVDQKHVDGVKECLKKVGVSSIKELNANNAGCFSRCCLMQKGLIDDSGKPHKEKIMNLMEEHLPEAIKSEWMTAIDSCLDSEGSKIDISDDKTCASFMPLTMCVHAAYMKICK